MDAKSASIVLARYRHLEDIPDDNADWDVSVRGAARLASTLANRRELAVLFRRIATVDRDAPISDTIDELEWTGPRESFKEMVERLDSPGLLRQAEELHPPF